MSYPLNSVLYSSINWKRSGDQSSI